MKNIQEFYQWERSTRDTIDVKKIYIDLADEDLVAGILLSQIIFWHLPDRENKSKLSIFKDGRFWIAKGREDWWDEIRISPKQFDRAIKVLEDRGLVVTHIYQFGGKTIKHISLNADILLIEINRQLEELNGFTQRSYPVTPKSEKPVSPIDEDEINPNVKSGFTRSSISYTEITSEIPEENTTENNSQSVNQSSCDRQTDDYPDELKTILDNAELEAFNEGIKKIIVFAIEDLYFSMGSAKIVEYPLSIIRSRMLEICYPVLSLAWGNYSRTKENRGITNRRSYFAKCIWSALIESPMDQASTLHTQLDIQNYIRINQQIDLFIEESIDQSKILTIDSYPELPFGRLMTTKENRKSVIYWDRKNQRIVLDSLDPNKQPSQGKTN